MRINVRWLLLHRGRGIGHVLGLIFAVSSGSSVATVQDVLQEVTVTGSLIRQNPLEVRSPVQVFTSADIEKSGIVGLGDYLQSLPIAGASINRSNNTAGNLGFPPDGSGTGTGASEIDLRYLGSKRTLVLVDGRRWVHGSSASGVSGAVDLNTIPANAIESIEILQDGASTIYGSDAIAGVVNVITHKRYDGKFNISLYDGAYSAGDGQATTIDVSWGAQSDQSRVWVGASYEDQRRINSGDRAISAYSIPGLPIGVSSGTPQGTFFFTDPRIPDPQQLGLNQVGITLNGGAINTGQTGVLPQYDPNNPCGGSFHCFTTADRYNYQSVNVLATPNQRVNLFTKGELDLSSSVSLHATAGVTHRRSSSQAAPEPLFLGPGGAGGQWLENVVIPANQLYNPFGITLDSSNIDTLARRPLEAGPRIFEQTVNTFNVTAGLDGRLTLARQTWYWDVTGSWFLNHANQRKEGDFNAHNLVIALGDPLVCAATNGCVPFNFFGGQGTGSGSITQAMLDYVTYIERDSSEQTLADLSASLSGHVFELPAGPVGLAVGIDRRQENGDFTPDPVVVKGESADPPASPTHGGFTVTEYYAETVVPLLRDAFLAQQLDISGAARFSDYSLFGSKTVLKAGVTWTPMSDWVVRASWSQGFRAPNIGELFNTGSRFDAGISDPCSNATGSVAAHCAQLGVPAHFVASSTQVGLTTGGNTALKPEEAKTSTLGFTWNAHEGASALGLGRLIVDTNYYQIHLTKAIQAVEATDILSACVSTLDPFYCSAITRATTGDILRINNRLQNIAGIKTEGIDGSVSLATRPGRGGELHLSWLNSYLLKYDEAVPGPDGTTVVTRRAGTELGVAGRGFPTFKSTLTVGWQKNDWSVDLTNRYISALTERCGGLTASFAFLGFSSPPGPLGLCTNGASAGEYYSTGNPGTNRIKREIYTDLVVGWSTSLQNTPFKLQLGAQNLLDRETPVCRSCTINGFDGTLYPLPGRYFYGRVRMQF